MSVSPQVQKKFERWLPRLGDKAYEVVQEAAKVLVEVASLEPDLRPDALAALASYIKAKSRTPESDDNNVYWVIDALDRIDAQAIADHSPLMEALASSPVTDEHDATVLLRLLWRLIETGAIDATHSSARKVAATASAALKQAHGGGRREAMQISDWAEDSL